MQQRPQQQQQSNGVKAEEEAEGLEGGLGMFDDEAGEGVGVQWQAPQGAQRPKPRKLTGPWGEYSGATVAPQKGPKKKPGMMYDIWSRTCTFIARAFCLWSMQLQLLLHLHKMAQEATRYGGGHRVFDLCVRS